jgi:hypothetical protein
VSGWACTERLQLIERIWLRGVDLNHRPLGYEPNELPGCSTPHKNHISGVVEGQTLGAFTATLFFLRDFDRAAHDNASVPLKVSAIVRRHGFRMQTRIHRLLFFNSFILQFIND